MAKILVQIAVPAAAARRDVLIPYECRVHEVTALVKAVFAEETAEGFKAAEDTVLCDAATGDVLDVSMTPEELGLRNGARLMLI